jgi:hypothetical protein
MSTRQKLRLKPLQYLYDLGQAPFNASPLTAQWPSMNVMISSNRVERRWDHEVYRTFDDDETIQHIAIFRTNDGTYYTLVLTDTDLAKIMTGTGETYQYLTQTWTQGSVSNVVTTAVTGTDVNCQWFDTSGIATDDKFIMGDDHSAAIEPDANWAKVASVESNTGMTLSAAYTGADTSGAYKVRKLYSCPVGERWQYASVNGKFCFVNGNVRGQYWNGTDTYATDIDSTGTYVNQARYCTSYANRLVTADMVNSGARSPWLVRWSKEGDPTNYTDSTAGFSEFIDTEEPITGLGVAGSNLIVFKKTAYYIGYRTGEATSPLTFPTNKRGIGLYAPYSLVHVAGTVAWMGLNDFYFLNGDEAESIGDPIRKKFFDLVADDELERVFGINNSRYNEILWVANTDAGQYVFAFNWKERSWSTYQFSGNLTGLGCAGV